MIEAEPGRALRSIDDDLRSHDDEVRRLAVERVSELPEVDALPRVSAALGDASWRVRKAAIARVLALPGAREFSARLLTLPTHAGLDAARQERLLRALEALA